MPESNRTTGRALQRLAGAAFVGGLTISALAGPAGAVPEPLQPTSDFCANVPDDFPSFSDVSGNADNIRCLTYALITTGTDEGTYEPGEIVNREQMASFIARLLDLAFLLDADGDLVELPEDDGTSPFTDPISDAHAGSVNRLFEAGIVQGGPGDTDPSFYGASLPVTRAQMATFLNRAVDYLVDGEVDGAGAYQSDENSFVDNAVEPHVANVNGLANRGIVQGFSGAGGSYAPLAGVNRDQMASFLLRTAGQLLDDGEITELPPPLELTRNGTGPVTAGTNVTGLIAPGPLDSVAIDSPCTPDAPLTDQDLATEDFEFDVPTEPTAPGGDCEITFTVTLGDEVVDLPLVITIDPLV